MWPAARGRRCRWRGRTRGPRACRPAPSISDARGSVRGHAGLRFPVETTMSTLIRRGVDHVLKFLLRKVAARFVAIPLRRRMARFEAATHDPRGVQEALLQGILAHHAA